MGSWEFYFLAKLYLYFRGYIDLDFILNLLFAAFLIIPIPQLFRFRKVLITFRLALGLVLGSILLWYESWLPPLSETTEFIQTQQLPKEYIYTFLLTSVNWVEAVALGLLLTFSVLVRNHLSLTPLIMVLLVLIPLRNFGQHKGEMERYLDVFYQTESRRAITYQSTKQGDSPFDIIFLHICSLSWQDLRDTGLQEHPFLKQFDYLFTQFNTVTSYTNPSAIRLLRANCGQPRHDDLYRDVEDECYLFDTLRTLGYETYFTLNHDGQFGKFAEQVMILGHLGPPLQWTDLTIQQRNFDGSPIYDNYAALVKWWDVRQRSGADRVVLYHNNISLHDGTYWVSEKEWWKRERAGYYREVVDKLFNDLTRFFDLLAASGRKSVIIFVPEHGMALSGSRVQLSGIREIPLPQITLVPVGIKLIGSGKNHGVAQQITKPTSYLALAHILASFLKQSPFDKLSSKEMLETLPETHFVAENRGVYVVKRGDDYLIEGRSLDGKWITLSPELIR